MKQILKKFASGEELSLWLKDNNKHYKEIEEKYPADEGYHCILDLTKRELILTKEESKEDELVADEDRCPYCGSANIDCSGHSVEGSDELEMQMFCDNCEKKFVKVYDIDYDRTEKREW